MPLRILLIVALLMLVAPLHAQTQIALPPLVSSPGADRPVELQAATISVERAGGTANTTVELTLHNPSSRPLEGQLAFPLRDGQQVSGFALDVDGEMHDAVPVTKERGREVFEAIERRNVDPALLERTEGNHFRLRVFPVPAGGERHVRIELVEALQVDGDEWRLLLPLQFAAGLERVPLHVSGARPQFDRAVGSIELRGERGGVVGELGPRQLRTAGGLGLRWPRGQVDAAQTQVFDGEVWFHAELPFAGTQQPRVLPSTVGLLWDASGSAAKRDLGLEFALLDRYFAAAGDIEVRLQLLRDRAAPVQRFRVHGGDWSALRTALRAVAYDGATDLGAWTAERDVGEYLLFSDGLANYGNSPFPTLRADQRLFAIGSAGASADTARLQALAEARGGWFVDIAGAAGLEVAVQELLRERLRVVAIDAIGAGDVAAASPFPQDGRLRFGGRLTAAEATLSVTLARADGRIERQRLVIAQGEPADGRFLAQIAAGYRLRQLQADPAGNRTAIRLLGERYGLVSAETSLLVLETIDDYVRYDIVPPKSMRAEFDARRAAERQSRDDLRRNNLDGVASAFAERRQWWETDFSKRKRPTVIAKSADEVDASAADYSPMPVPAPPAESPVVFDEPSSNATEATMQESRGNVGGSTELDTIAVAGSPIADKAASDSADLAADESDTGMVITLQPWAPDSDIARRLRAAPAADVYRLYLDERTANADSPAFYLDVADILLEKGRRDEALRVLSNLAEMQLENRALLRVLGYRLMQADAAALAVPVFARVRELADEEPQSHRDLGLALDAAGQSQQAVDALYEAVARPWDGRFGGIALIALGELNAIVARGKGKVDTKAIDPRLLQNLPVALRAVLTWDADATDMDLWVTQPDGEQVSYNSHDSAAGGRLSDDFTGGYGPEEYAIRRSRDGVYRIEVDHYGSSSQLVTGAVTVQVWLSTEFGTPAQKDQRLTVRLSAESERLLVGEFTVD